MADTKHATETPISLKILRAELQTYREAMTNDIKLQIDGLHQEIKRDISSLREEAKADTRALRSELVQELAFLHKAHRESEREQAEMGGSLSKVIDQVAALEQAQEKLIKDHKKIHEKCTDLENRSRRQNLRIVGVKEGIEAGNPISFAAEFFSEVFGAENFVSPLVIDRAHRTLAPKPGKGERPRALLVRLHYYSDKEKILRLSRNKGCLLYKDTPVHIFPDMSPEVGRQRAAFNAVKAKLRDAGIVYSLFYPARLTITVNGTRHAFDTPQDAEKFYKMKISTTSEAD